MNRLKKNSGFTLMELLAVVGIISVLVTLSISVFTASTDNAKRAVCQANRRNIKAELSHEILLNSADPVSLFPSLREKYTCPSGGIYSLKYDAETYTIDISCSVHGNGLESDNTPKTSVTANFLKELNALLQNNLSSLDLYSGSLIDSGAPDTFGQKATKKAMLEELLKTSGIDFSTMDVESWRIEVKKDAAGNPAVSSFYWTTADISNLSSGSEVIVMKYNFDDYPNSDYKNLITVYNCTIRTSAETGITGEGNRDYMVLDTNRNFTELPLSKKASSEDKADIDTMRQIYEDAVAASTSGVVYG